MPRSNLANLMRANAAAHAAKTTNSPLEVPPLPELEPMLDPEGLESWDTDWRNIAADEDVFAYAYREDRIFLTHDTDFLDDRHFPPHRNPGVVVLPGAAGDELALVMALSQALSFVCRLREAYREVKLTVSSDGTITIRRRILETGAMRNTRYRSNRGVLEEWQDIATE